jgi:hypothetical protein
MDKTYEATDQQYLDDLIRMRKEIADGIPYSFWDDDTIGDKDMHCSWGMAKCYDYGMKHPLPYQYRGVDHKCPLDRRSNDKTDMHGCFWTCRVFNPKNSNSHKDNPEPTPKITSEHRDIVLQLFDAEIRYTENQIAANSIT